MFVVLAFCAYTTHAGVFGSEDTFLAITKDTTRTMNKVLKGVALVIYNGDTARVLRNKMGAAKAAPTTAATESALPVQPGVN